MSRDPAAGTVAPSSAPTTYRPDIQGLRAVAVASVVAFHAMPQALPGGFLGVDIFFVVSGYLITAIIVRELSAGSFSPIAFYRRRLIRILPALAAMVAAVGVVGCAILLPSELHALGRSMVATMGFAANIAFYRQLDYFAASEIDPLLHTWSLGVEEQFYILYPLVLAATFRISRARVPLMIALVSVVSLLLALRLDASHPTFVFFMLPTRVWEIGAGALVATLPPIAMPRIQRELAALSGLIAMIVPVLFLATGTASPYPSAVIAVAGAAVLLGCGAGTLTGRALSLSPLGGLGAVSYSLYLWHWPVLAFYRMVNGIVLTGGEVLGLLTASLLLAIVSWYGIERPLMDRRATLGGKTVFSAAVIVILVLSLFGLTLYGASSAIANLPPRVEAVANVARYRDTAAFRSRLSSPCPIRVTRDPASDLCLRLDPARADILVIGDSFALQIWQAVAARNPGTHVIPSYHGDCRPLFGTGGTAECRAQFDYAMRNLVGPGGVDTVVLAARWHDDEIDHFAPTIRALRSRGARVAVIGPAVEFDGNVPELMARAMLSGDTRFLLARRKRETERLDRRMERIARAEGASYFSLYRAECPVSGCKLTTGNGLPLHWDMAHLTTEAALELTQTMSPIGQTPRIGP